MGQDGQVFFLGFWYPQLAVYDDVVGWNVDQYLGMGEFYMGYADYDVRITVPQGFLVAATGELMNAADVLAPITIQRLAEAETATDAHRIADIHMRLADIDAHTAEGRASGVQLRREDGQVLYGTLTINQAGAKTPTTTGCW